jgi:predicted GNAT family acetyltransferase
VFARDTKLLIAMIHITITETEILATENGKLLGKIEFTLSDNKMSILHTYAYESGRGIGTLLMQNAVEWAKEHNYEIIPVCSFAQKYLSND